MLQGACTVNYNAWQCYYKDTITLTHKQVGEIWERVANWHVFSINANSQASSVYTASLSVYGHSKPPLPEQQWL